MDPKERASAKELKEQIEYHDKNAIESPDGTLSFIVIFCVKFKESVN